MVQADLGGNAALLPVLDALDAAPQASRKLGSAAKALYQVFVGEHRLLHGIGLDGHIKHYV